MRNILAHPVDRTEVLIMLDRMIAEASNQELVGDMRPSILASLRTLVSDRFDEPDIKKFFEMQPI